LKGNIMSDTDGTNASEVRRAVYNLQEVVARLPENPHKDNAMRAAEAVRDHAMRSLETPPDPSRR
jgi:hypothetical protein